MHIRGFNEYGAHALYSVVLFVPALLYDVMKLGAELPVVFLYRGVLAISLVEEMRSLSALRLVRKAHGKKSVGSVRQELSAAIIRWHVTPIEVDVRLSTTA